MSRRTRMVPIIMLILALGACGEEARISGSARLVSPLTLDMLTVTVRDRDRVIQWTGADFKARSDDPTPVTPEVETSTTGPDLEVSYRLESAGAVLSMGTVAVPRRRDWRWAVTIWAATTSPEEGCFGCFGSQGFPLAEAFRAPERDSIWVVWSGNSISDPGIY
jgi:hypothetical protein